MKLQELMMLLIKKIERNVGKVYEVKKVWMKSGGCKVVWEIGSGNEERVICVVFKRKGSEWVYEIFEKVDFVRLFKSVGT